MSTVTLSSDYDDNGNRISLAALIGTTADFANSYTYNPRSEMTQVTQQDVSGGNAVADKLVNFGYDSSGQLNALHRFKDLSATLAIHASLVRSSPKGRQHYASASKHVRVGWRVPWGQEGPRLVTRSVRPPTCCFATPTTSYRCYPN